MYAGIYRIVNQVTNRTYIGSSENVLKRLKDHRSDLERKKHVNAYFQASWAKHGASAFIFEPLVECDKATLTQREQAFIDAYFDHDMPLYNLKPSADPRSAFRYVPTKETRAKLGAASKGRVPSPETRAKLSTANIGKRHSPETRAKLGAAARNRSPELRAKISAANRNRSPEYRAKLSAFARNRSPETRAKLSTANIGKRHSPETRAKLSAAARARCTPEWRAKRSLYIKAYWAKRRAAKVA